MKNVALALFALAVVYLVYTASGNASGDQSTDPTLDGQMNTPLDTLAAAITAAGVTLNVDAGTAAANQTAFLSMIGWSEGADYNTLYGGGNFDDYSTHPNQSITAGGYTSTAAGKYQILYNTWTYLAQELGLSDFSPATQDAMAVQLIKQKGAYTLMLNGQFADAVALLGKTWASLPGSPYGQPIHSIADEQAAYTSAGGTVASA